MILKKPYAFLIKHFRLINLFIAFLAGFIGYKTYQVVAFFNEYVNNSYTGNFYSGFYQEYVSPLVFFALILILLGILAICILFIYKKKKVKSYTFSFVYYLVLLIYFIVIRSIMIGMQGELLTAEIGRACRDISIIVFVIQIPYLILFLIRFLGFNIGNYNFKEDLKELEISEQDSEEVEITFNKDSTKLKRTYRRFKREFLYYIKENKFIFIIICLFTTGLVGYIIYKALPNIVDAEYNQGDIFYVGDLTYKVEDSIITTIKYNGDVISKDKYYLVIKMYIENNGENAANIDYNDFRLELSNNNYIYPDKGKEENFIDYAKNIFISNLQAASKNTYSLVFELDNKDIKKRYRLKIANGVAAVDNNLVGKFNYVTITPIIVNDINQEGTYDKGKEISFVNSNLGATTLTLSNPIFTKKLVYDYQRCNNNNCQTYKDMVIVDYKKSDKILLVMDYDYKIDKTVPFYNNNDSFNKFINSFMKIRYIKNEGEFNADITNVTPDNLTGKFAIEVPSDITDAAKIYLVMIIRNKEYLVVIK